MSKRSLSSANFYALNRAQVHQQKKVHYTATLIGGVDKIEAHRQTQAEAERKWQIQKTLAYAERKDYALELFMADQATAESKADLLGKVFAPSVSTKLAVNKHVRKGPMKAVAVYKDTVRLVAEQPTPMTFKEKVKVGFELFRKLCT